MSYQPSGAFYPYSALEKVVLPNSVASISYTEAYCLRFVALFIRYRKNGQNYNTAPKNVIAQKQGKTEKVETKNSLALAIVNRRRAGKLWHKGMMRDLL